MLGDGEQAVRPDSGVTRAAAFGRLVDERLDAAYRLARLILRDPQEAEDATHDAFVKAWRDHHRLRDPANFDAWFNRIVVNACRDRIRHRGRRRHEPLRAADAATAPHDAHRRVDQRDAIERAFHRLNGDQQMAVVLRYFGDLPVEEVARTLRVPVGTIRSRLHYALRLLRAEIEVVGEARP